MRRLALAAGLSLCPAIAMAASSMPQMDFSNPLTTSQVVWMAVILAVLYLLLAQWGLPAMGKILARRAATIEADLNAARAAKAEADKAVADLNKTMKDARAAAQSKMATAVAEAKAQALAESQALAARLEAQLADSEAQIAGAREAAIAAIKPVAAEVATEILLRLTGRKPEAAALTPEIDAAYAAQAA